MIHDSASTPDLFRAKQLASLANFFFPTPLEAYLHRRFFVLQISSQALCYEKLSKSSSRTV